MHSTADRLAIASDWGPRQVLQFHEDLLERQDEHEKAIMTEQQIRQDEELARFLIQQELELELQLGVGGDNFDDPSQETRDIQDAEADRHHKEELELNDGSRSEENQSEIINPAYDLFFAVATDERNFVGVACIIKDSIGRVLLSNGKCIGVDIPLHLAEYIALIYGLEIAKSIGLRRINAHGNRAFIYWEVQRQIEAAWAGEQREELRTEIKDLDSFTVDVVSRAENEDTIELANYVRLQNAADVMTELNSAAGVEERTEHCRICLEAIFPSDMVSLTGCKHEFCFDCLSQHVENEISTSKVPIRCPEFAVCGRFMDDHECEHLVSPKAFDKYLARLAESAVSDSEKVYCPFKGCSAMMYRTSDHEEKSSTDVYAASSSSSPPLRANNSTSSAECMECHRLFCVDCKVPWHANLTCPEYQALPPNARDAEDVELLELAKENKWRKCGKCRSMIMLAGGCFHMTCRCGNQFCYTCGTNYQGRMRMCSCPLFSGAFPDNKLPRQEAIPELRNPEDRVGRRQEARRIQQANDVQSAILTHALQAIILQEALDADPPQQATEPQLRNPEDRIRPQARRIRHEANDARQAIYMHQLQANIMREALYAGLPHEAYEPQLMLPDDRVRPQARRIHEANGMHQANTLQENMQQQAHANLPHDQAIEPQLRIPEDWIRTEARRIHEAYNMQPSDTLQGRIQEANMQQQADMQERAHIQQQAYDTYPPHDQAIPQLRIPEDRVWPQPNMQQQADMQELSHIHQQARDTYPPHDQANPQLRIPEDRVRPQARRIEQRANILPGRIQEPEDVRRTRVQAARLRARIQQENYRYVQQQAHMQQQPNMTEAMLTRPPWRT
ncbi:unnamed protein product [Calypogeia fissa]